MQVTVGGKVFVVKWNHQPRAKFPDVGTYCYILSKKESTHELEIQSVGGSYVSKKDQYSHDKGRKISFSRALLGLSKEQRLPFWKAFFNMRHENYLNS